MHRSRRLACNFEIYHLLYKKVMCWYRFFIAEMELWQKSKITQEQYYLIKNFGANNDFGKLLQSIPVSVYCP